MCFNSCMLVIYYNKDTSLQFAIYKICKKVKDYCGHSWTRTNKKLFGYGSKWDFSWRPPTMWGISVVQPQPAMLNIVRECCFIQETHKYFFWAWLRNVSINIFGVQLQAAHVVNFIFWNDLCTFTQRIKFN